MACDISNGRLEACKDSVSGLDAIYIINFGINIDDVTYSATVGSEDVITAIAGVDFLYKKRDDCSSPPFYGNILRLNQ